MINSSASARPKRPLSAILKTGLEKLGTFLYWTGYYVEHLLILEMEGLRRAVKFFDPRMRAEEMRVRSISEGRLSKPTGKFFILVIFPGASLPRFTRSLIDALRPTPFNLVVVANQSLAPPLKDELLRDACLLIERNNIGRDFGGYKDGIGIVLRRFADIKRLVIANDSVYYLPAGLDKLLADLDGPADFIGVSEVFDHHYHVGSFLASFGERVIRSAAFTGFWTRFLPFGTRRWNIFRGEGALTRTLMDAGFQPHVLFKAEHLRPHLRPANETEFRALLALMPLEPRAELIEKLQAGFDPGRATEEMIAAIMSRNQMHMAGFLFRKFSGLPVIKRDIYFREIYSREDISTILADLDPRLRDEVLADVARRGTAADLGWWRKFLYRHSVI